MGRAKLFAASGALLLALLVYAVARAGESAPRSSSTPVALQAPPAETRALEVEAEATNAGSARQALAESAPADDGSIRAPTSSEPALATLEIQVLRGDEIALDARAWLVSGYHRQLPADLRAPAPGYEPVFTTADARGVLRFEGLAPGAYRTAIELDDARSPGAPRGTVP